MAFYSHPKFMYDRPMTAVDHYDARVGANVRKLRQARGLNQDQLAARVAERGVPFRQQTIVKIEKGERPLRLREADAVTAALDVDIDALVGDEVAIDWTALLMLHTRDTAQAWDTLLRAAKQLLVAQAQVRRDLDTVRRLNVSIEVHILNEALTMLRVDAVEAVAAAGYELDAERAAQAAGEKVGVRYVRHDQEVDNG